MNTECLQPNEVQFSKMPEKKMIDLNLKMRVKDLRSLVLILGGVSRLHIGVQDEKLIIEDLKNAIKPEAALKLWDLFVKAQVDIDIHPAQQQPEEVISIEVPVKNLL